MASTDNYIYRHGTTPNTRAAVSQKNKVFSYAVGSSGFQQIGVVSEFGFDESRSVEPARGVGFGDHVAELVPGVTEPMTLNINRTLLYAMNVLQAVGYKGGIDGLVRSLKHHRWPFDIKQELVFSELSSKYDIGSSGGAGSASVSPTGGDYITPVRALFTFFEGCWIESYNASFTADAALVAESATVKVTDIIDGKSTYGEFPETDTGLSPSSGAAGQNYSLRFAGGTAAPTPLL